MTEPVERHEQIGQRQQDQNDDADSQEEAAQA